MIRNIHDLVTNTAINSALTIKSASLSTMVASYLQNSSPVHLICQMSSYGTSARPLSGRHVDTLLVPNEEPGGYEISTGPRYNGSLFSTSSLVPLSTVTNADIFASLQASVYPSSVGVPANWAKSISKGVGTKPHFVVLYVGIGNAWQIDTRKKHLAKHAVEDRKNIIRNNPALASKMSRVNSDIYNPLRKQWDGLIQGLSSYLQVIDTTKQASVNVITVNDPTDRFVSGMGVVLTLPNSIGIAEAINPILYSWLNQPADTLLQFLDAQLEIETIYSQS